MIAHLNLAFCVNNTDTIFIKSFSSFFRWEGDSVTFLISLLSRKQFYLLSYKKKKKKNLFRCLPQHSLSSTKYFGLQKFFVKMLILQLSDTAACYQHFKPNTKKVFKVLVEKVKYICI